MALIKSMSQPRSLEEVREAIVLLLRDHFGLNATVERDGYTAIVYHDGEQPNGESDINGLIIVADPYLHPEAARKARRWRDDLPGDDGGEAELRLRKA